MVGFLRHALQRPPWEGSAGSDEVKKQVRLLEVSEADLKELVKGFFFFSGEE